MSRDHLYLLKPDFFDNGKGPYFCPGCAQIVGLLDFYPELKQRLSVEYVDFPRPRSKLAACWGRKIRVPLIKFACDIASAQLWTRSRRKFRSNQRSTAQ